MRTGPILYNLKTTFYLILLAVYTHCSGVIVICFKNESKIENKHSFAVDFNNKVNKVVMIFIIFLLH